MRQYTSSINDNKLDLQMACISDNNSANAILYITTPILQENEEMNEHALLYYKVAW